MILCSVFSIFFSRKVRNEAQRQTESQVKVKPSRLMMMTAVVVVVMIMMMVHILCTGVFVGLDRFWYQSVIKLFYVL